MRPLENMAPMCLSPVRSASCSQGEFLRRNQFEGQDPVDAKWSCSAARQSFIISNCWWHWNGTCIFAFCCSHLNHNLSMSPFCLSTRLRRGSSSTAHIIKVRLHTPLLGRRGMASDKTSLHAFSACSMLSFGCICATVWSVYPTCIKNEWKTCLTNLSIKTTIPSGQQTRLLMVKYELTWTKGFK